MKHVCASFTGFGQWCSVSTLTSKNLSVHSGKSRYLAHVCNQMVEMGEIQQTLTAHQAHKNVAEWRNEPMEKTHNPHYKEFWHLFLKHVIGEQLCIL